MFGKLVFQGYLNLTTQKNDFDKKKKKKKLDLPIPTKSNKIENDYSCNRKIKYDFDDTLGLNFYIWPSHSTSCSCLTKVKE